MTATINPTSSPGPGIQPAALAVASAPPPPDKAGPALAAPASSQGAVVKDSASSPSESAIRAARTSAAENSQAIGAAVQQIKDYFQQPKQNVTLQVDHDTGESFVKIVNADTKQLILQIPSEEVLAMAQKLQQMANSQAASGVLVDQQG